MSLDLILAADGDADRSETILLTPDGTVLTHADGGPANPSDIGTERAVSNLQTMFDKVLAPYGGLSASLQSVYVGFAGGWVGDNQKRYYNILRGLLPNAHSLDNSSDAINALTSGIGQEDGISLIAGMGSIALVRCCGTINQVGGWGYLIGDEGSSFELGRMGLREALMALKADHEFLLKGDVFTQDVIDTWIRYKIENEVNALALRPHPWEFKLYYDI